MNILVVDDLPALKVDDALMYLQSKGVKFDHTLALSVNSALRYLHENLAKVDLAIIDLGLPRFDNERVSDPVEGFDIVREVIRLSRRKNTYIPIIINSTTKIEETLGRTAEENFRRLYGKELKLKIEQVEHLEGPWLYEFLKNNMPEKMELVENS